jgi:D-tyrosyl-tRNA(Tyr) deacylase
MKATIQRVQKASVTVEGELVSEIDSGLLILLGVGHDDSEENANSLANKISKMRIFEDEAGKMNLSIRDTAGEILVISQFTLFADTKKGNRPSFIDAARPAQAIPLYEYFCAKIQAEGIEVKRGIFGADMEVMLINDGPVTINIEM